jgi:hypothetical protein
MRNFIYFVVMLTVMTVFAGCGATGKEIALMGQSEKTDIFTEVMSEGSVPAGYADVVIKASVKIPFSGYYPLESKRSVRGKTAYPFLMNIDGQAVLWQVEGQKHLLPEYVDGKTSHDPDAGEGIKYVLEKRVRLAAGPHKVFLGLPDESYFVTADISVKNGGSYLLEFKPDYRYKTSPTRIPTFLKGIDKFDILFKEMTAQDR